MAGNGPFEFAGQVLAVTKRQTRDEAGEVTGTSFFFKSAGAQIQKVS
jgi:hypothetical protein